MKMSQAVDERVPVAIAAMRRFGWEALEAAGLSPELAAMVTEVQLEATVRGQPTHNIGSIPGYARAVKEGRINKRPVMRAVNESASHARLDADDGPGQWAGVLAMRRCIEKAKANGMAAVGVQRSNHFGAAGFYASMAVEHDLIGLCTTNGGLVLAPWGGATPTFGNNPLGLAIPAAKSYPIMLDVAFSTVAMGKVALSLAQGKGIPAGWYMDSEGRPTTDPKDYPEGLGVPIAEHKGYGLVLLMEVLAGVLSGAGFGWFHEYRKLGATTLRDIGHFFIAINPAVFMPIAEFKDRVETLIEQIKASRPAQGSTGVVVPGEPEWTARERNLAAGTVPLLRTTHDALVEFIREWRLKTALT